MALGIFVTVAAATHGTEYLRDYCTNIAALTATTPPSLSQL